jgi:hypothetical protein
MGFAYILAIGSDSIATSSKDYREFHDFNVARSKIYDYEGRPTFDMNFEEYYDMGIDRTIAASVNARYLDVDPEINTETYKNLIHFTQKVKSGVSLIDKLTNSFVNAFGYFLDSNLIYRSIFIFFFSAFVLARATIRRKKQIVTNFPAIFVIFSTISMSFLEIWGFEFISRVLPRLIDVLLLAILFSVVVVLSFCDKKERINFFYSDVFARRSRIFKQIIIASLSIAGGILLFGVCVSNQHQLSNKANSQHLINSRLTALDQWSVKNHNAVIYYDSYDFIAASADVFAVYDHLSRIESLGNWAMKSPMYYKRNQQLGITYSIDAIVNSQNPHVYFASIFDQKAAIRFIMSSRFNSNLCEIDQISTNALNINIYSTTKRS